MSFKFSDYYNDENICLSEETIRELLGDFSRRRRVKKMIPKFFKALRIAIRRTVVLFRYITSEKNKQMSIKERWNCYWREQDERF